MKILGIGIDIVENERVSEKISQRFLSNNELQILQKIQTKKAKLEFCAGRWAAKEAIIKATNLALALDEIEILKNDDGSPQVNFKKDNIKYKKPQIMVSISHETNFTVANAIYFK